MIVIDNFIKDKKYLKELNNKKSEFFKDVYDSENYHHDVNWWKGWWEEKSRNVNEQLIEYIMKDNNPFRNDDIFKKIKGFEYWTHIHSKESSVTIDGKTINVCRHLGWHTNKDELLHYEENKFKHPMFSIIFWPFEQEVKGGYLEMSPIRQEDEDIEITGYPSCPTCRKEKIPFGIERIKPKYNRLVIQDTSYWHRVTRVEDGTRWTFVVDVWDKEIIIKNKVER